MQLLAATPSPAQFLRNSVDGVDGHLTLKTPDLRGLAGSSLVNAWEEETVQIPNVMKVLDLYIYT